MNDDIRTSKRSDSAMTDPPKNDELSFAPPESMAEQDEFKGASASEEVIDMADEAQKQEQRVENGEDKKPPLKVKNNLKAKLLTPVTTIQKWLEKRSKKQRMILIGVAVLVLAAIVAGAFLVFHKKPAPKPAPVVVKQEVKKEAPKPTTEPSKLTGIQVPPEYNKLPVTGIMIENSPDARPQSGLNDAGVVFEAVAEGGITRFLTLFQEAQPDYVGPVRSVRPYYLRWLQGFDAAVAHVGGSGEALDKIQADGIKDLDQFYNGGAYHRIPERYAPHNVYTSVGSLLSVEKDKGWTSSNFTGFVRKVEKAPPAATVKTIDFAISGPLYNAHYDYEPATNTYNRSEGGQPHVDERSGKQLSPKVVIALIMSQGIDPDGIHSTYNNTGTGKAYIFQDGGLTEGTWSKPSEKDQIKFVDAAGKDIGLNPGQTWLTALGSETDVTHAP